MMTPEEQIAFDELKTKNQEIRELLDTIHAKDETEWVHVASLLKGIERDTGIDARLLFVGWKGGGLFPADLQMVVKTSRAFVAAELVEGGIEAIEGMVKAKVNGDTVGVTQAGGLINSLPYSINLPQQHLTILDEDAEHFTFQVFDDNKERSTAYRKENPKSNGDPKYTRVLNGTLEQHYDQLVAFNRSGSGIFITVNRTDLRGRRLDNIQDIRCVFHELDQVALRPDPIEPHFIVSSSKGKVHKYWLCDELSKDDFKGIQARMVNGYGSDSNATDISRVLRLSGFYHMKSPDNPQLVSIIHESGGMSYSRDELIKAFPLDIKKTKSVVGVSTNMPGGVGTLVVGQQTIDDLASALLYISSDDREQWISVGHSLKELGEVGKGLWINWSAKSPSYDPDDIHGRWEGLNPVATGYKSIFSKAQSCGWVNSATLRKQNSKTNHSSGGITENINKPIVEPEIQDWKHSLAGDIDYIIPFDCVARDIQLFILERSMYPQPAFAYAAAMVVIGTCIGRDLRYDNIKGNMMFIAMLESGGGKDFPFKMAKKILQAVDYGVRIESKCASGVALFEALEDQPSLLLHIDEYGHYLEGINGKGANVYAKEIVTILTEAYTSGSDSISGKRTKGCDPIVIQEPNVSVFGMSTERQIFDGLRSSDVADGSLARYKMLFGIEKLMPRRVSGSYDEIPIWLIDKLTALKATTFRDDSDKSVDVKLHACVGFDDAKWELDQKARKMSIGAKNPSFSPFYARASVRAVQGCLLVDKCSSVETLQWFSDIEFRTIDVFVKKFNHLSADNENERLFKMLEQVIKESGKKGVTAKVLLSRTRQIPTYLRKQGLIELEETGTIHVEKKTVGNSPRASTFYYWLK